METSKIPVSNWTLPQTSQINYLLWFLLKSWSETVGDWPHLSWTSALGWDESISRGACVSPLNKNWAYPTRLNALPVFYMMEQPALSTSISLFSLVSAFINLVEG